MTHRTNTAITTVALVGNPNAGKSTLFNCLTGSQSPVGNYPGVTVELKTANITFENQHLRIVDLPGVYSLSAYSQDEIITRDFIINERPDWIVHVADASSLERHLYLYTQLMELERPVLIALNKSDLLQKQDQPIEDEELSQLLGCPVVRTVSSKCHGIQDLLKVVTQVNANYSRSDLCRIDYGEEILEELFKLDALLASNCEAWPFPIRWLSLRLLENDPMVVDSIKASSSCKHILEQAQKSRNHLEHHFGDNAEVIMADRRYGFVNGVCAKTRSSNIGTHHHISDRIDSLILRPLFGIPLFALVMFCIFKFTFVGSRPLIHLLQRLLDSLASQALAVIPEGLLRSLLVDGIIGGVGGVLGFFPLILFMFFAIAFFEDSGYMARAAFVMDSGMRIFGLHGKSFLPMMISTNGCAVPGMMATRTLENRRDRLITLMVIPFMICGAKLPILAIFIGAFFSLQHQAQTMFAMYLLSIALALGSAWVLKETVMKGVSQHFIMELPPFRMPHLKGLFLKTWERGWTYLKKAGTVLLLFSILVWAAFSFPQATSKRLGQEADAKTQLESSFAGQVGHLMEPIIKPLGLDWRMGTSLIAGLAAKEMVISTLGTIYSLEGQQEGKDAESLMQSLREDPSWTLPKALGFMLFCMIYVPCLAAVAIFFYESGSSWKWTFFMFGWTTGLAWLSAFATFQIGTFLNIGGPFG